MVSARLIHAMANAFSTIRRELTVPMTTDQRKSPMASLTSSKTKALWWEAPYLMVTSKLASAILSPGEFLKISDFSEKPD
jgi:hypothetical protein